MRYPYMMFDVGGTMIGPRTSFGAMYADVMTDLGVERPAEVFETSLRHAMDTMEATVPRGRDRYRAFPDGEEGFWARFARLALEHATGEPPSDEMVIQTLRRLRERFRSAHAWEVYPDVQPALVELAKLGVRLAIVSNWDSRLPDLLRQLDLARHFNVFAVSHIEGVEKPHPRLFQIALERLGAEPGEALHVGDLPHFDTEGADAAGVDSVLIQRNGRLSSGTGRIEIRDFGDLPRIAERGL
jgi:putative hydrolase of the HAD superfamily